MNALLGIDIGTTHCKVGLFNLNGKEIKTTKRNTSVYRDEDGSYFEPEEIWGSVVDMIQELVPTYEGRIEAIGITSMAETGLLLDRKKGLPRIPFIPWFDQRAKKEAEQIAADIDALEHFSKTGLRSSYKYGLAKILWLKNRKPDLLKDAVWLSAADYIAYRLTGEVGTDYTLAARTYAFRIDQKKWDSTLLDQFGLNEDLFPNVLPSGKPVGVTNGDSGCGLQKEIPVAVSGHDHVCAALAVGAVEPGIVFDSVGTAETLVGTLNHTELGEKEFHSGLSYGCHVVGDRYFWMGGASASGGSLEWLRSRLSDPPLSYESIRKKLSSISLGPTGILYFPYLSGSGAPKPDANVKAAFIGISEEHKTEHLIKAVLEGTAFEMESIRRSAEAVTGEVINEIAVVGGGTQNEHWMQIKADVSGCPLWIPSISEATLLGAVLTAGIGCGIFGSAGKAISVADSQERTKVISNEEEHKAYQDIYEKGYLKLQDPLRKFFS
ncbi:MAG TPA: FGGY family carbohydrate kinase [Bacillales bacterium]|nr:FGGY family carbohydrate kinase [Bacillales bacterium]